MIQAKVVFIPITFIERLLVDWFRHMDSPVQCTYIFIILLRMLFIFLKIIFWSFRNYLKNIVYHALMGMSLQALF
jgi:hypothetical protein